MGIKRKESLLWFYLHIHLPSADSAEKNDAAVTSAVTKQKWHNSDPCNVTPAEWLNRVTQRWPKEAS